MLTALLIALATLLAVLYLGHCITTRRAERRRKDQVAHCRSPIRCATPLLMAKEIEYFEREHGPIDDYLRRKSAQGKRDPNSPQT